MNQPVKRVVIVGGGFAGLFAARMLARAPVQVTLIDRAEHHLFQPMLYQCATGILSEGKIAAPLRQLLGKHRNVDFVIAEVTGLDAEQRRLTARRPLGKQIEFGYDYLILAAGVRQSYFGHDEYAAFAPGMKTIEDAMKIRRRIFGAFELAESEDDPAERARWLTFALVGAGPTGVELAGQIREVATKTLRREYRHIKPQDARVLLFDGGKAPLAMFGPKLSALAARDLGKLGVELHMGSIVTHVDLGGLEVKDHDGKLTRYDAGNILWTAGVEAPPLATAVAKATGAEQDRAGRIVVGKDLAIPGHPEILVTGDVMSLDKLPGVAEVAMQTGLYAGRKIGHLAQGKSFDKPFTYRDLGSAAYISRGKAVVSAFKLNFGGFLGWWVWLFIHIGFLTGYRNRIGAVLGWWFAFTRDIRRERTFTIDDMPLVRAYGELPDSTMTNPRPGPKSLLLLASSSAGMKYPAQRLEAGGPPGPEDGGGEFGSDQPPAAGRAGWELSDQRTEKLPHRQPAPPEAAQRRGQAAGTRLPAIARGLLNLASWFMHLIYRPGTIAPRARARLRPPGRDERTGLTLPAAPADGPGRRPGCERKFPASGIARPAAT